MSSQRELRNRIRSIRSICQITKAMEVVSSVKLRGARGLVAAARPYAGKIAEIATNLSLSASAQDVPLLQRREVRRAGLVIVGANKGLCGSFNTAVCNKALHFMKQKEDLEFLLFLIGKKTVDFFRPRSYKSAIQNVDILARPRYGEVIDVAEKILASYLNGEIDEVFVLCHQFQGASQRQLQLRSLLPVPLETAPERSKADYIFEPEAEAILNDLLPRYFFNQIWVMILESYAAEQLARMQAMHTATQNATDLINHLTHEYHKARQASITKELLEIVGGAQALS